MFEQFMERYAADLDATMRRILDMIPADVPDFKIMAAYPLGWVDETGRPYEGAAGKRIRPLFLLLCTEAAGGDWHQGLYAAAAVELLHNFSLIHDDIQDDSPLRHNRPTVWRLWGRPNAINVGDLLFALAYSALGHLNETGLQAQVIARIWEIFNRTNLELTRGQHLDMQFEHRDTVSVDEYVSMIAGKSAALLSACAQMGALIATGNEKIALCYGEFALNMGVAFQIRDDILGIWGDPDRIGKSTATDILSKKKSLPVLYGLSKSARLVELYRHEQLTQSDVDGAVAELDRLQTQVYAHRIESDYYGKAMAALDLANPRGEAAAWLRQFVAALFNRSY